MSISGPLALVIPRQDFKARKVPRKSRGRTWHTKSKSESISTWDNSSADVDTSPSAIWSDDSEILTQATREPPSLPESRNIPFTKWYRFLRSMHDVLLDCCSDFAQKYGVLEALPMKLENAETGELMNWGQYILWAINNMDFPSGVIDKHTLESHWGIFCNPERNINQGALEFLRHAMIHRESLHEGYLTRAMKLPKIVGDSKRQEQVDHMFEVVTDGTPEFDETDFPLKSCTSDHQACAEIQAKLERLCHRYVSAKCPDKLGKDLVPEQWELNTWFDQIPRKRAPQDEFTDLWNKALIKTVWSVRQLRNAASHRSCVPADSFNDWTNLAIQLAFLLDDQVMAMEIHTFAREWLGHKAGNDSPVLLKGLLAQKISLSNIAVIKKEWEQQRLFEEKTELPVMDPPTPEFNPVNDVKPVVDVKLTHDIYGIDWFENHW